MLEALFSQPRTVLFQSALIFSSVFEWIPAYILVNNFFPCKLTKKPTDILPFIICAAVMILVRLKSIGSWLTYFVEAALFFLLLFLLYKGKIRSKLIGGAVFIIAVLLSQYSARLLITVVLKQLPAQLLPDTVYFQLLQAATVDGVTVLLSVLIGLFIKRFQKDHTSFQLWLALFAVPVITILSFSVFQFTLENLSEDSQMFPYIYLSCAGLLFINILVFFLFSRLQRQSAEKRNTAVLTAQLVAQEESVKRLETLYNRTRAFRHDIKNHILLMKLLAEQGNTEELKKYLQSLSGTVEESDYVRISGVSAVDAILNEKLYEAQSKSITAEYDVVDLDKNGILPLDLCIILSNALDNAMEANLNIEEPTERYIKLKVHGNEAFSVISVKNPYRKAPVKSAAGAFLTSKQDKDSHGFGLKSIENTVKKYNGEMIAKGEDGVFTLVIRLNAG